MKTFDLDNAGREVKRLVNIESPPSSKEDGHYGIVRYGARLLLEEGIPNATGWPAIVIGWRGDKIVYQFMNRTSKYGPTDALSDISQVLKVNRVEPPMAWVGLVDLATWGEDDLAPMPSVRESSSQRMNDRLGYAAYRRDLLDRNLIDVSANPWPLYIVNAMSGSSRELRKAALVYVALYKKGDARVQVGIVRANGAMNHSDPSGKSRTPPELERIARKSILDGILGTNKMEDAA